MPLAMRGFSLRQTELFTYHVKKKSKETHGEATYDALDALGKPLKATMDQR